MPPDGAGQPAPSAFVVAFAAAITLFHLWLVVAGLIPNLISRPIHMALAAGWIFLVADGRFRLLRPAAVAGVLAVGSCLAVIWFREPLEDQYGALRGWPQFLLAAVLLGAVLEMARRQIKAALPSVALLALAYGLFGQYLPGPLGHPGLPAKSLLGTLVITEGGIWGPLTGISAEVVAIFVILGAFVGAGEGGRAFMSLAVALAGRLTAGAAKVSVVASALFGSISGSASANVASTGAVTLPTMKRLGYPPAFAAAVEAVASSGGQIMPPIMGAGAFVMMELLQLSYTDVLGAALLPAILFFAAAWFGIDLSARRYGLKPVAPEDMPARGELFRLLPFFLLPFGLLLWFLFARGVTPEYAAASAAVTAAALLAFDIHGFAGLGRLGRRLVGAVTSAASQIATIASVILCAGIVIGVLNMTGLGVKITSLMIGLSGGQLWIALLLTAAACLILGMEVPTTAAYVICISVAGPALHELGVPPLVAHMFVFWYALLSTITPPVCGTVFIAAGMADAPWLKVAAHAMKLGVGLYLVPLGLVANPALIALKSEPFLALAAALKIGLGLGAVSWAATSRRGALLRLAVAVAGFALIVAPVGLN